MSEIEKRLAGALPHVHDAGLNRFGICLEPDVEAGLLDPNNREVFLYTVITVDGEQIEPQQCVDLPVLIESLRASGRFEIFVCSCRRPRFCGASFHGVEVEHRDGRLVRWTLQRPQYVCSDNDPFDEWIGPVASSDFRFSRVQMVDALLAYFEIVAQLAAAHPDRLESPIEGQPVGQIPELRAKLLDTAIEPS